METVKMNIKNSFYFIHKGKQAVCGEVNRRFFWIFEDVLAKIISENLRFFREKTQKNVTKSLF